jgi:sphingosine kinase
MSCNYQRRAVVRLLIRFGTLLIPFLLSSTLYVVPVPSADTTAPKRLLTCPIKQFLLARLAPSTDTNIIRSRLDLHALSSARGGLHLTKLHVLVEPSQVKEAEKWVEAAMRAAYGGQSHHSPRSQKTDELDVQARKRILVLVNPVGGKGKARSIVKETVLPIFEAAGCAVTMMGESIDVCPRLIGRDATSPSCRAAGQGYCP